MDGRKSNGGVRKGAGRPKKVEEEKLIEKLDSLIDNDEVIKTLGKKIKEGSDRAMSLYFGYRYGKPKEMQQIDVNTKVNIPVIDFARPKTIDVTPENERIGSNTNEKKD